MNPHRSTPPTLFNRRGRRWVTLGLAIGAGLLATGLSLPTAAWAAEQTRALTGFQAVALESAATVRVELADRESVQLSGEDKALENVETAVETRQGVPTLVIRQKSGVWSWARRKSDSAITITVKGPKFEALSVAGSGELEAKLSNQPGLKLSMAGSGDLRVQGLTAHDVDVSVAGSGDVRVQGAAQNLEVKVAGSGDAWLKDLQAEDVRVSVAGSGDARVTANQRLRASVAGSGDVRYSGPVTNVTSRVAGSGTVKRD